MINKNRINNSILLESGLDLMRKNNMPLTKVRGTGRAKIYKLPNGETVRVRTCNDHILIVVASSPDIENAGLNIEGTDLLLIVMPVIERTEGDILAYLVPTEVVVKAVKESHRSWLQSDPNTKGGNTTWNLWFDTDYDGAEARDLKHSYATKWSEYRLEGTVSSLKIENSSNSHRPVNSHSLRSEIKMAQQRIARVAEVPHEAIRISIDFTHAETTR